MAVQHDVIQDPYIHEPKGASTASAGEIYISDGLGSGSWALPSTDGVGAAISLGKTTNNTAATTITALDTYYPVAGTFTEEDAVGMTTTVASGRITVVTPGSYLASASLSMISSRSTAVVCFTILVNGVQVGPRIRRKIGTGSDVGALTIHSFLPTLSTTDYIQIGVTFLTGEGGVAGDTVTIENASLISKLEISV